jgi:hypothetical protein
MRPPLSKNCPKYWIERSAYIFLNNTGHHDAGCSLYERLTSARGESCVCRCCRFQGCPRVGECRCGEPRWSHLWSHLLP